MTSPSTKTARHAHASDPLPSWHVLRDASRALLNPHRLVRGLRVGVFDATFSVLRLVGDGSRIIDEVEVFRPTFVHSFDAPDDVTWIRAEVFARPEDTAGGPCELNPERATYCDNRIGMLALSSPIYVSDHPPPSSSASPDPQQEASSDG